MSISVSMRSKLRSSAILLAAFILGGLALPNLQIRWKMPQSSAMGLGVHPGKPFTSLSPLEVYAHAAQIASPSVVFIKTHKQIQINPNFMQEEMGEAPQFGRETDQGSGVIITPNGYILTNEHVVGTNIDPGRKITATLIDGHEYPAKLIGADFTTDVALLKINAVNLPAAKLGTVSGLVPGQMCVAIGNPLGLQFTVTSGVVSALDRPISLNGRIYAHLIQHSAGIYPGNSGGPLCNIEGQVIGINTLVQRQAEGIGFAIPIDTALHVANELKRFGHIKRPSLGVVVVTNTQELSQLYGLPSIKGVVISDFYEVSAAQEAGLQKGDIITKINGKNITTEHQFERAVSQLSIGKPATLEVHRGDSYANVTVTPTQMP